MDFVGIGFWEIVVVLIVALIVVGPQRLPEIARKMGRMMRKFRMATTELSRSINEEINKEIGDVGEDIRKDADQISAEMKSLDIAITKESTLDQKDKEAKE